MTIYLESYLIENALINFCLLKMIALTTKPKTTILKMILASILGAFFNAFCLNLQNYTNFAQILRFFVLIFMLLLAFKQKTKNLCFSLGLYYLFNFCFVGVLTILSKLSFVNLSIFKSDYCLELFAICAIVLTYIFENVVKQIKFKIKKANLIYRVKIFLNGKTICINAFLDTGNLLTYNKKPVVVLDLDSFLKLTNQNIANFYLCKSESIKLSTVAGNNSLKIFEVDKIEIKLSNATKTFEHQYIAVNNLGGFKNANYQALITPQFI